MAKRKRYQKQGKGNKKKRSAGGNSLPQLNQGKVPVKDTAVNTPALQYRTDFCRELREHCSRGGTMPEFAFRIGATMNELNDWGKQHPEFRRAMELAALGREAYWWQLARASMNEKFNAAVWKYVMEQIGGRHSSAERKAVKNDNLQDQYVLVFPEQEDNSPQNNEGSQEK